MTQQETEMKVMQARVRYFNQGFTELKTFPGEYLLMINPKTMEKVRVYFDGSVWKSVPGSDPMGGDYVKEP